MNSDKIFTNNNSNRNEKKILKLSNLRNQKKYEVKIAKKILDINNSIASKMKSFFSKKKIYVVNIMSSPGAGKTTFLQKVIPLLINEYRCSIIVGDICTNNDANRLSRFGINAIQINTDKFGGDCHLTAASIKEAIKKIDIDLIDLLIIENIGNLVCPAEFNLGEDLKVSLLSTTEGEDKPAKYPLIFKESNCVILNKIDLLPYLNFDKKLVLRTIESINSKSPIFEISAITGEGIPEWSKWLKKQILKKKYNRDCIF